MDISPENLIIAENTPLILPIHGELDRAREGLKKLPKLELLEEALGQLMKIRWVEELYV